MEGKKKFEKPELQVVEMKRNLLAGSGGGCEMCCGCENNE
jgi:hypothetical protein